MNNTFPRLIDGMCATLRSEVLSRLEDEFARGQVFGVINLLNTFKARADWSVVFLAQQIDAQSEALNQVREQLTGLANAPVLEERHPVSYITPGTLGEMRDEGNCTIGQLLAWLSDNQMHLPSEKALAIENALRQSMRKEIEIELKNSPRPLFAEMSSGQEN
jgi:hypothetical protein